jgi:hypothetical protein
MWAEPGEALGGLFVVGLSSAAAGSAHATAMSAPTESARDEQPTRRKKRRSILANDPQHDIPAAPEHCRIGNVNLPLKGI